jgi:hypothetical protein
MAIALPASRRRANTENHMHYEERRCLHMLTRVSNFGAAYRQLFPETSSAADAFAAIAAELPHLEALDVAERVATHNARAGRKAEARKRLLDWLTRARLTTAALARTIPELAAHVEAPATMDDQLLLTIARQFQEAITPHAQAFATHGISVARLGELIEPFALALEARGLRQGEKVEARARIIPSMTRALEALKTLDLTVPNHLADDPATLAVWKRERAVNRLKRRKDAAGAGRKAQAVEATSETAAVEVVTDAVKNAA